MANEKISELPALANPLDGTEVLPVVQSSTTSQASIQNISDYVKPYKVYSALLTQSGTDAPTAIVLENTLGGEIVWSRDSIGEYYGTLNGVFKINKVWGFVSNSSPSAQYYSQLQIVNGDINSINVQCFNNTTSSSDNVLLSTPIEIRVYN